MRKLGKRQLTLELQEPLVAVPPALADCDLALEGEGTRLVYTFDRNEERTGIASLIRRLTDLGVGFKDLHTHESSLEDIFVSLVSDPGTRA